MSIWRNPRRVAALLASCGLLALQSSAQLELFHRHRAALAPPTNFTDPLLHDKLGRTLQLGGLHLVGTVLLILLLLALWLPRWPDLRAVFRAALPVLCVPLCGALAWLIWAGVDLRYTGDANAIGVLGAVAGIFLPLLSAILVGQLRSQAGWRIAPLFVTCLLIELWSLSFGLSALVLGLGA